MNYRETTTEGPVISWRRAHTVTIINPYRQMPRIRFDEEDRTALPDGRTMVTNNTAVGSDFSNPMKTFPLIHPETGDVIGEARQQDVYVMLFSLYMALAAERDTPAPTVDHAPVEEV